MKLFSNGWFYFALLVGLMFWCTAIFAAVKIIPVAFDTGFFPRFLAGTRENWALLSLVISEFASLLPGPWNGIVQSIVRIATKILEAKNREKS